MPSPHLDQYLCLLQGIKDLSSQQFIVHPAIERFDIAVFPGTARLDEKRLDLQTLEPGTHALGRELRTIVGTDVNRHTPFTVLLLLAYSASLRSAKNPSGYGR